MLLENESNKINKDEKLKEKLKEELLENNETKVKEGALRNEIEYKIYYIMTKQLKDRPLFKKRQNNII